MAVLFVVLTIVFFLAVEWFVRRVKEGKSVSLAPRSQATIQPTVQTVPVRIPEGIFFATSHTWLNLFPSGKVRLGVDDFVGRLLEKPEVTYLKQTGDAMKKGDSILVLTEGTRSLTVRAPLDGVVLTRNEELQANPDLLKQTLFSDGWAYTIKPQHATELRALLLGQETRAWMREEFRRLRDVFAGVGGDDQVVPALLQDGGPPVAGALKHMDDTVWKKFEQEFLEVQ